MRQGPPLPRTWPGFFLWLILLGLLSHVLTWLASGESAKLAWNPNPEPDIAGYRVEYGVNDFSQTHTTGNVTTTALDGLVPGTTYQLRLVAINKAGLESDPTAPITHTVPPKAWTVAASSEETAGEDGRAVNADDGNPGSLWHTAWSTLAAPPHWYEFRFSEPVRVSGIRYLPRQDGETNGTLKNYEVLADGLNLAYGQLDAGDAERVIVFPSRAVNTLRLAWSDDPTWASAAEIRPIIAPPEMVRVTIQFSDNLRDWTDVHSLEIQKQPRQFFRLKLETP